MDPPQRHTTNPPPLPIPPKHTSHHTPFHLLPRPPFSSTSGAVHHRQGREHGARHLNLHAREGGHHLLCCVYGCRVLRIGCWIYTNGSMTVFLSTAGERAPQSATTNTRHTWCCFCIMTAASGAPRRPAMAVRLVYFVVNQDHKEKVQVSIPVSILVRSRPVYSKTGPRTIASPETPHNHTHTQTKVRTACCPLVAAPVLAGQLGPEGLRGVGDKGEEEEGGERRQVQAADGRDQTAKEAEEGVGHHEEL